MVGMRKVEFTLTNEQYPSGCIGDIEVFLNCSITHLLTNLVIFHTSAIHPNMLRLTLAEMRLLYKILSFGHS